MFRVQGFALILLESRRASESLRVAGFGGFKIQGVG